MVKERFQRKLTAISADIFAGLIDPIQSRTRLLFKASITPNDKFGVLTERSKCSPGKS
jgi:hypothetical protein